MSSANEPAASECVAVAVEEGEDLSAAVGAHFGRSPRFLLVREGPAHPVETLDNPHAEAAQGAGSATASLLVRHGVTAVLAGRFGPKAEDALRTGGIAPYAVRPGTKVSEALENLRSGALQTAG